MRTRSRDFRRADAGAPRLVRAALYALAVIAGPAAAADGPDDGSRARSAAAVNPAMSPAPHDRTYRWPSGGGSVLDLTPGGDIDAATLDARGAMLSGAPDSGRLVAHDVLAGLLAWEAGRGLGEGAHARPVVAMTRPETFAASGTAASRAAAPALGAAFGAPSGASASLERTERYRYDALDLSLDGPPVLPDDILIDDVPSLAFERRTIYQATSGRLLVDFRLRHRDPAHGMAALDDEERIATAIARMRSLSTLVLEPVDPGPSARF